MSEDDNPQHGLAYAPGGMIPPGVLDPTIVTLNPPTEWGQERYTASQSPTIAQTFKRFFHTFDRRTNRPLGGFWRGGEIARRHHDTFVPEVLLQNERPPLISDERIEELYVFMGLNNEPGEKQRSFAINQQIEEITPQFFLRNVKRAKFETNPNAPPYQLEIWRDPAVPERDFPTQVVLTYKRPQLQFEISSEVSIEERQKRWNLMVGTHWADDWGNWWMQTERPRLDTSFFPTHTIPVVRGRFANEEEAAQEAEAKRKGRKKSIHFSLDNPEGVWTDDFKR